MDPDSPGKFPRSYLPDKASYLRGWSVPMSSVPLSRARGRRRHSSLILGAGRDPIYLNPPTTHRNDVVPDLDPTVLHRGSDVGLLARFQQARCT
jgi:hypothetical protein